MLVASRPIRYVVPMLVVVLLLASCGIGRSVGGDDPAVPSTDGLPRSADGRADCKQADAEASSWWEGLSNVASATSLEVVQSVRDLTWASQSIVRGRIVQVCPPEKAQQGVSGQYRDYVLAVEKVYRGQPSDRIVVREDTYGEPVETGAEELVGDSVIMFLAPERDGAVFPVGGPQGRWEIRDGRVWGTCCSTVALTLSEFEQAVAFSLSQGPSNRTPGDPVSLADAPKGPDLPPAQVRPAGCGGILNSEVRHPHSEDLADLAWYSHQIIVGTVGEQLPSAQAEDVPGVDPILQPVVTDYRIQVDARIRGLPANTLRVRQIGGTFGDCTVTNQAGELFAEGDQVLLFLSTLEPGAADPTYYPTGDDSGIWHFDDTGTVVSNWKPSVPGSYPTIEPPVIPMIELVEYFTTVLTDPPPRKYALIPSIIPPADAPITTPPISWPDLPKDGTREWVRYEHPVDGWSLAYPSGWKLLAPGVHGGTTTFASYETSGAEEEHLPDGGFRLDLYQVPGPTTQQPHPLTVGAGEYPGILSVGSGRDGGYRLSAWYYAAGNHWRLTGWFDEPPTVDNPNTLLFFQIVDSITHNHPPPAS